MRYKLLGKTGLRVSELALGTMTFGQEWGWGASKEESRKMFDAYAGAEGNFIDTANRYTNGTSEQLVGEFIEKDRDHFVLATKYTLFTRRDDPNSSGNHRKNMLQSLEASLKRLKTDRIDLYWVHAWDFMTPIEEVMRSLDDMVRAGKILYAGISDTPAWVVSRADMLADFHGWTPFAAMQLRYSLIDRTIEREHLPMARSLDMAVTAWGVLGTGVLSVKSSAEKGEGGRGAWKKPQTEKTAAILKTVETIAKEKGCTPSEVALNWVRQQKGVLIPIIGARTASQIRDNLDCLNYELTSEEIGRLDAVSRIDLGFPYDFLEMENIRDLVYGGTYSKIDNHRQL